MFKLMFASVAITSLLLTGCPDQARVRVVEERRPVVVERREGGEHRGEEHREEIRR